MEALVRAVLPSGSFPASPALLPAFDGPAVLARLAAPAHPAWLPDVPLRVVLHALRVAVAWRAVVKGKRTEGEMTGLRGVIGFLVLGLGGSTLASILLSAPPAWLTNPSILPLFIAVYYLSRPLLALLLPLTPQLLIDAASAALDAVNRTASAGAVCAALAAHPDSALRASGVAYALLGAVACAGGGVLAGTLGLWDPEWTFQTPAVLRRDKGAASYVLKTMDVWSGALVAVLYATLLDLPPFAGVREAVERAFGQPTGVLGALGLTTPPAAKPWSVERAQHVCTALLAALLLARVALYYAHAWTAAAVAPAADAGAAATQAVKDGRTGQAKVALGLATQSAPRAHAAGARASGGVGAGKARKRKGKH